MYVKGNQMSKLDLVRHYKEYYTAKNIPTVVNFDLVKYITILGKGEPAGEAFIEALEALYPLAYGIKNAYKKQDKDFGVAKLEGLWWVESRKLALETPREEWYWKLLIRMPDYVEKNVFEEAKERVIKKKGIEKIKSIKLETITEGKCVQIMHIGPYSEEPITIKAMKVYYTENNYTENGLHHEVYLSDPRKTAPEKMKTILRQPIK
jgi:hypothetical protein